MSRTASRMCHRSRVRPSAKCRRSDISFCGSAWARQDSPRFARRYAALTRPARSQRLAIVGATAPTLGDRIRNQSVLTSQRASEAFMILQRVLKGIGGITFDQAQAILQ